MSNYVPEIDDLRKALIFLFTFEEKYCKRWFQRFRDNDFDVINEERGAPPKKFEDAELQAVWDKDDILSQKQMAEMLNVTQQTILDRLKAMGKIQKC